MQSRKNGHRNIWLLSGTGEGPYIAAALIENGWNVTVSVVTASASNSYSELPLAKIQVGPLQGVEGIKNVFVEAQNLNEGFDWVLDATHPFALEISLNLNKACQECDINLIRFERPLKNIPGTFLIQNSKELSQCPFEGRNLLIAIGARYLKEAVVEARRAGARVFTRVLPTPASLRKALSCSLHESDLALLHPSQGKEMGLVERALCRRWSITDVICRQSGGLSEKLWQDVCKNENINLWLFRRPSLNDGVEVVQTIEALFSHIIRS